MKKKQQSIFHNYNFTVFFVGSVISQIGSMLIQFATSLYILDLTGKAIYMSIYLAITFAIFIVLQPIFGAMADRLNKAKLISILDYVFGFIELLFVGVLFLELDSSVILVVLFANGAITSLIAAVYQPASTSMVPLVSKENELTKAYSYMAVLNNSQQIVGIILASFTYMMFGYKWILLFDAITYIIAAFLEMFIKVDDQNTEKKKRTKLLEEVREGFAYMYEKKELVNMAKIAVMMNIFIVGIFSITLPFMINTDMKLDPYILGVMNGLFSGGGLIMAMIISSKEVVNVGNKLTRGFSAFVLSVFGIAIIYTLNSRNVVNVTSFIVIMGGCMLLMGSAGSYIQIPLNISYAMRVEKEYMGRVMAIRFSLSSIATPFAMVTFGILIDYAGTNSALIVGVVGIAGATFFTKKNKYIRAL